MLELALPARSDGRGGFVGTKSQRWVVTADGSILSAGPADKAWKIAALGGLGGKPPVLNAIFFLNDDKTGWAAGNNGVVYTTFDAGAHWIERRPLSDRSEIRGISFVDSLRGWAAGAGGVYGTLDGGENWSPAALTPDRLGKWIDDDSRSYSLEAPGVLRVCPQAGQKSKHCADLALNILVPPLAAWLALLLAMATFGLAVMSPSELTAAAADDPQSAATAYASDKPLVAGQPDILKLDNIARGLADFLVNRRTEPPLSLAIDGPWGSGKSSLLNLFTQSELSQRRFGVVWFNAWHHEKEENTLGAILTMICRDAIAGPFSALGLMLRWNLLRQRIQKNPLRYLLGASILIFAVAYVWVHPQHTASVLRQSWANLQGLLAGTDVAKNLPAGALGENAPGWLRFFSLSLLLLFVFYNLRTSLSTFAAAAKWSLPRIVFTRDRRNLMSDVGLRNRFAKEFAAVTKALRPRRLVIVIDDLDRCQPEKVVEILQLTNFLMSSGDCFVIIAADLNWVEACVREQYKKVGEVLAHGPHAMAPNAEQAADNLADFSNRYLRKIINVMIRVPKLTPALARDFIQGESMDGARAGAGPKVSLFGRAIRAVGLVTAIVLPIALVQIYPNLGEPPPPVVQGKVTTETVPGPSAGNRPVEAAALSASSEPAVEKPGKRLLVRPPEAEGPVSIFWFLLPALILAFFGWVAWQVWRVVEATRTTDSRAFTVALQRWGQAIFIATPTPRDIRRFTNQARYLSAQRKYFEGSNLKIDELVRFAALEFIDREWFDSLDGAATDALTAQLADGVVRALPQEWGDALRHAVVAAYQDELRSSEPAMPPASSDESAVDKFRNLTASSKLA